MAITTSSSINVNPDCFRGWLLMGAANILFLLDYLYEEKTGTD
jgi:hypothetical protein